MKFKFKNLIAFTLSEMMIVLLIVSVISAATIPTITQKKQKPYDVSENNSNSAIIWQNDNFSGIFSAFSLRDKEQSVVIGKNTKNDSTCQTIYGSVIPALMLAKSTDSQTGTSDRGQIMLYDNEKFVGSFGFDRYSNLYMGYGSAYDRVMAYNNASVSIGDYASVGQSGDNSAFDGTISIGSHAMHKAYGSVSNISIGAASGAFSGNNAKSINIGFYAGSHIKTAFYTKESGRALEIFLDEPSNGRTIFLPTDPYNYGNIAIGAHAGRSTFMGVCNFSLPTGPKHIVAYSSNNNVSIGYYSAYFQTQQWVGNNRIAIGSQAGSISSDTISIGYASGIPVKYTDDYGRSDFTNYNDISIGAKSNDCECDIGYIPFSNNILIGVNAGTMISRNRRRDAIAIGAYATTNYGKNIAIGNYAEATGDYESTGLIAIGAYAFSNNDVSRTSIAIGRFAAYHGDSRTSGSNNNIYIGRYAGYLSGSSSSRRVFIGNEAGSSLNNNEMSKGLFIGYGTYGSGSFSGFGPVEMLPYASKTLETDTGDKFSRNGGNFAMLAIGPGYGYPGGPSFNNTILVLYAGSIYAKSTTFTPFTSDRRSKENIEKAKYGIEQFRHINTYTYNFKFYNDKKPRVGLIAQEVQKYIPEAIVKSADGTLTIDFDWILYPLANAIKDVDKNLTQLKNDLVAQAKDLTQLEKRIFKLENKTTKTLEKQEKMQDKLNQVKDIVNMETK